MTPYTLSINQRNAPISNPVSLTLRQRGQPLPIHAHADPLLHPRGADTGALIEPDAGLIPLEHSPLEALASQADTLARERRDQRRPEPRAPVRRPHEQVLQVDPRRRVPRAVVVEEQRHACD